MSQTVRDDTAAAERGETAVRKGRLQTWGMASKDRYHVGNRRRQEQPVGGSVG
jgi:hypothetical protein